MKRFIITSTALAMALASGPGFPALAQDYPQAEIDGQIVLCLPNKQTECPQDALCTVAKNPENCARNAEAFLAELAAATATPEGVTEATTAAEGTTTEATETEATTTEATATEGTTPETTAAETPEIAEPATAVETAVSLDETPVPAFEPFEVTIGDQAVLCLPDKALECPEGQICTYAKLQENCEANATKKLAKLAPVAVTVPDQAQVDALAEVIADPANTSADTVDAVAATKPGKKALPADSETSSEATVTEEVLSEDDTRASTQEFAAAPEVSAAGTQSGLTDLEVAGLVVLGTLAVGALFSNGNEVVENSGDRVVVQDPNGNYTIYKDDDALLREAGTRVRTETFADGSTRTVMVRPDGTQIVTIRDATGRVLQRSAYDASGVEVVLIDDLSPENPVDVTQLPKRDRANFVSDTSTLPELLTQLDVIERADYAHSFSLRQIREIREVRDLAPTIDVNSITFDTGSSAIKTSEAKKLQRLGRLMKALIERHPGEMFLIEGHTDAVGRDSYNLALSDRRAESLAKALTEYFGVPAQNLVVQGYGEKELRIDTQGDERLNRRAAVRIITPLLKVRAN